MTDDERLEHDVVRLCFKAGLEPKKTKASGQVRGDGDVTTGDIMFECKFKDVLSLSVSEKDLKKAASQAQTQDKLAVIVRENSNHIQTATLCMEDFMWILSLLAERELIS